MRLESREIISYTMLMKNTSEVRQPKKRGPRKRDYVRGHVLLPPEMLEWGLAKRNGFSAYVRDLIEADMERARSERRESVSA